MNTYRIELTTKQSFVFWVQAIDSEQAKSQVLDGQVKATGEPPPEIESVKVEQQ